jgi:sterol desaturase/sphingolipid hydroxylase (fatty acid hydroxylase superfamily)
VILGVGLAMLVGESRVRARSWPATRRWWPRAVALNAVQGASAFLAAASWDTWLQGLQPFSLAELGLFTEAALGYLAITFVHYFWRRARHAVPFLWRWFHQIHHSPARIEIITSFYKHPVEIVANGVLSSAILYWGVGLTPEAVSLAVLMTGVTELFYHWNVSAPHWLGYLIQRPESHCVHPQRGLHHYNYADLPVWDILFGTFPNPRDWRDACGLGEGEYALSDLLLGRPVHDDPTS